MKETHDAAGASAADASEAGRANVTQDATGTAVWLIPDPKLGPVLLGHTHEVVNREGSNDSE